MAHIAPEGLRFEYWGGLLIVMVDGEIENVTQIAQVCEIAARISERIRAEAEESRGIGLPDGAFTPQEREARQRLDAQLAKVSFEAPPTEVALAAERFTRVAEETEELERPAGGLGFRLLTRLFNRSIDRDRANQLAFEAVLRAYAWRHDLTERSPTPDAAARWLLDPARAGRCALVVEASALALVGEPIAITDLSAVLLDEFCAAIVPIAQAFGAT